MNPIDDSNVVVGDPVRAGGVVGRVVAISGGLVELMTPWGSIIRSGFAWVDPLSAAGRGGLRRHERATYHAGRPLYREKFSLEQQAEWGLDTTNPGGGS